MKGRTIILDHIDGREAAALMVDGKLSDILVAGDAPAPGTIYRAIADRPVKGQGGMFLKTPDGSAFLRQVKGLSPGQPLLVQVTGYAEEGKAIPVTQKVLFKSRYAIVTPDAPGLNISRSIRDDDMRDELMVVAKEVMEGREMGLILRSCCAVASPEDIADDVEEMAGSVPVEGFSEVVMSDVEKILSKLSKDLSAKMKEMLVQSRYQKEVTNAFGALNDADFKRAIKMLEELVESFPACDKKKFDIRTLRKLDGVGSVDDRPSTD